MPITKTISIKSAHNLERALKYIVNPEKTAEQILTSGYKINHVNNAAFEMELTRKMARSYNEASNKKSDEEVVARHIIQSFDPMDNLSPEEVHEIGRKTALELTGGHHEFVIATHIDQGHLHNHIIFNATSSLDLKKFRWHKRTPGLLRNISDKIADQYGALVLQNTMRNSHTKYQAYRRKNSYRTLLKERLNFVIKHSTSWDDFKIKAAALDIEIDSNHFSKEYGQVINYRLKDFPQERWVRDYTLNKKRRSFSLEKIVAQSEKNNPAGSLAAWEIKTAFEKFQKEKEALPDIEVIIPPEQIESKSMTGIYIEIDYGRFERGTIKIPDYKLDLQEDGSYKAYINYKDSFYFLNEEDKIQSKFVKGSQVVQHLVDKSGLVPQRKNSAIQDVREMVAAFNIVSQRQLDGSEAVKVLGEEFQDHMSRVKLALENLDYRLLEENEKVKFNPTPEQLSRIKALQGERKNLSVAYNNLVKKMKTYEAGQRIAANKINAQQLEKTQNKDNQEEFIEK